MVKRVLVAVLMMCPAVVLAQAPQLLGYQGRLVKTDGTPESGNAQMRFGLFGTETGGSSLWEETQAVSITQGYYSTYLGRMTTFPATLFDTGTLWLEVAVQAPGDTQFRTMTPRQRVGSVAFALNARSVKGGTVDATSVSINGTQVIDSNGKLTASAGYAAGPGISIDGTTRAISVNSSGCNTGQVLQWNGSAWQCATVSGSGGGISGVSGTAPITVMNGTTSPVVSVSVGTTAGTVAAGDDSRFGNATTLLGRQLSASLPDSGMVLTYSAGAWIPQYPAGGGVTSVTAGAGLTGGAITSAGTIAIADGGVGTSQLAAGAVTFDKMGSNGCTAGQLPKWNGSAWACGDDNAGGAPTRQYTVAFMMRTGTNCPSGFNQEPLSNLQGGDGVVQVAINSGSLFLGASAGALARQGNVLWSSVTTTNMGATGVLCWQTYQTSGNPMTHFIGTSGTSATCPAGYARIPMADLRGNNGYSYSMTNRGGFYLGYVDSWDYSSQQFGGGWTHRYWATTLGGNIDIACVKTMGVESDPSTRNGVYAVVLGVKGPAICPAGYTYRATAETLGANNETYLSMTDSAVMMGGLYSWAYGGESYQQTNWNSSSNVNYCWRFYPRVNRPAANIRALNGFNCPSDHISLNVSDVNGNNANVYIQRVVNSLYIGGLVSWARQDYTEGSIAVNITTQANRICYKVENVASWP